MAFTLHDGRKVKVILLSQFKLPQFLCLVLNLARSPVKGDYALLAPPIDIGTPEYIISLSLADKFRVLPVPFKVVGDALGQFVQEHIVWHPTA